MVSGQKQTTDCCVPLASRRTRDKLLRDGESYERKMMRFALFGAGRAGTIHARNIASHPRAELGYVFDVDQSAAQRLAALLEVHACDDQQEIWQADNVDAVLIASSSDTHVDLLRQAMRAGKPTYCEKTDRS